MYAGSTAVVLRKNKRLNDDGDALVFDALVVDPLLRNAVVEELVRFIPINPIDGAMPVVTAVKEFNL
jgi:hypothetical protein